jgi:hypothetical protein
VIPTTANLAVGEIAINTVDKSIYVRDSSDNIVQVANFAVSDPTQVFPTGDYGSLSAQTVDAFGISVEVSFDASVTPNGSLSTTDLGGII